MCCLFGIIDYNNVLSYNTKMKILRVLSKECEERGTDATGIAYLENDKMTIFKRPRPAHKMKFRLNSNPSVIMGHTRLTTQGDGAKNYNNHPFLSDTLGFALAHNGVLYNDTALRRIEHLPDTPIETDSYIAVQLIDSQGVLNSDTIRYMTDKIEGSFCFTILDRDNTLYIIKGDNPMAIAELNGFYVYASTKEILDRALYKLGFKEYGSIMTENGDILKFTADGKVKRSHFTPHKQYMSYYDYYGSFDFERRNRRRRSEYVNYLIEFAAILGIDEDTIYEFLDSGFTCGEIEDMLYDCEYDDWQRMRHDLSAEI